MEQSRIPNRRRRRASAGTGLTLALAGMARITASGRRCVISTPRPRLGGHPRRRGAHWDRHVGSHPSRSDDAPVPRRFHCRRCCPDSTTSPQLRHSGTRGPPRRASIVRMGPRALVMMNRLPTGSTRSRRPAKKHPRSGKEATALASEFQRSSKAFAATAIWTNARARIAGPRPSALAPSRPMPGTGARPPNRRPAPLRCGGRGRRNHRRQKRNRN